MSTPICRCRVLYLGSAVPHVTKDGLQGIQEPLRELYPDEGVLGARGIDSWLSVWSNGLLLENVDEHGKRITRFFPVETLHYCAAVRHVVVPGAEGERVSRFLPLDSPFARIPTSHNPPLFACILRRTTGIKVLECHAFICKKEMAANALVRCCFHSYADNTFARQLEAGKAPPLPVTSIQKVEEWNAKENGAGDGGDITSIYNGDENHKVWAGSPVTSVRSVMSPTETTRSSRPRQMILPSKPPPPPLTDDDKPKEKPRRLANGRDSSRQMPVKHWAIPPPNASVAPRGTLPLMLMARSAEEPTYMPSARPLSPIASYQPAAFPYDQYLLHQHHHQHHHHPQRPLKTKRKQKSPGGDADSKFSTGIYRKKGHLNERAFSYSIRQEHRSRSHSSLATLAFSNGDRDISQMVTEISLSEDETDDEQQPSPQPPPN